MSSSSPKILNSGIVDVQFGANVKVVQPVNLYGCSIGDDCFISHGVMFINDLARGGKPAVGRPDLWKTTRLGNRIFVGSNATILPITICDDVLIGAGAVVTK